MIERERMAEEEIETGRKTQEERDGKREREREEEIETGRKT